MTPKLIVSGPGEGKVMERLLLKAGSEETGGAYCLIESTDQPGRPPVAPHIHEAEEESFYVVEGTVKIHVEDQAIEATAGTYVLIPRGTVHWHEHAGTGTAKWIVFFTPGGVEGFFAEIGTKGREARSLEELAELRRRFNIRAVPPPATPD